MFLGLQSYDNLNLDYPYSGIYFFIKAKEEGNHGVDKNQLPSCFRKG